jgi:carnitine O-palmitoyltransferase 1
LSNKAQPVVGEEFLASLTAWDRTKWAETRQKYFAKGLNKTSLYLVESAAFVLSLDVSFKVKFSHNFFWGYLLKISAEI